jgi:hypothetical protein
VVIWVPFNESLGVPDLPSIAAQRHYVQALYHLTHTLDNTRPVIGNDGWESVATDIMGIHDYDDQPERIARRYRADEVLPRLFKRERPGGRMLVLEGHSQADQPLMLTEFGGLALAHRAYRISLEGRPAPVIDGFTGDQRFFIGWAQVWRSITRDEYLRQQLLWMPHAPPRVRANGPLGHIEAFYTAFNVQPGDKLYIEPAKRIRIW